MATQNEMIRSFIARIQRLEHERKILAGDIEAIYAEAEAIGFNAKVMARLIEDMSRDAEEVREEELTLDLYRRALGL